ncbi:hypothetical protein [Streptomyces sp. NPDC060194]|uniref:hypothetical protein n=1 Tax=Streptomyces sp. NPDC060194 TaxID=3347069 RepID=UPI00364CE0C4
MGATPPPPAPPPAPAPRPAPTASPRPVAIPTYHKAVRQVPRGGTSTTTFVLLIMAPAVFAVAALRPR